MPNKTDQFNILISGVGGQGLITLLQIVAEAALSEGYNVRTSELHGLSQRGGSVEVHIRFGKKIYSPIIGQGKADLILGLEMQEALRKTYFANENTVFLVNEQITPIVFEKSFSEGELADMFKKFSKNINIIPSSNICREKLGTDVVSGVYLISYAVFKKMIPLNPNSVFAAIKKTIPEKYLELNLKAHNLAKN